MLVGHDIGLMVAYAYAQAYRDEVSHLVVMDAPLPGTAVFDRLRSDPRVWHFAFHNARDVAEMLVAGRERQYLQAFFNARVFDPSAISDADLEVYVSAYSAPGAMRAGFELYRAFDQDAEDNRAALGRNGKLTMPVLAVGGATSTSGPLVEEMMREVAENVAGVRVPGHGALDRRGEPAGVRECRAGFRRTWGSSGRIRGRSHGVSGTTHVHPPYRWHAPPAAGGSGPGSCRLAGRRGTGGTRGARGPAGQPAAARGAVRDPRGQRRAVHRGLRARGHRARAGSGGSGAGRPPRHTP